MRCFIALEVGDGVKQQCQTIISALKKKGFHAKWVEEENLHITMFFLGEISNQQIEETAAIVKNIHSFPFKLVFNGMGAFQKYNDPTAIWLGLQKSEPLQELYMEMKSQLEEKIKQSFGKKFVPHLTLGRVKSSPEDWKDIIKNTTVKTLELKDIVLSLKSSTLTKKGPIYKTLETNVIE